MEMPMVVNEANESRRAYAAACPRCYGWTGCGGMSQFRDSAFGCICTNDVAREALRQWRRATLSPLAGS
jgi:hypothetical protein